MPGVLVLAVLAVPGTSHAQVRGDKAVYFTFSAPVALPQTTLPAGRYLFRLADSLVNRTIVQIYSADGSKLHAMLMTIPAQRPQVADDPEVRFLETAANQPPAIGTYWYGGEKTGWEFIYPRAQARALAQSSKTNVLTTAQDVTGDQVRSAELVRVSPTGEQVGIDSGVPAADAPAPRTARGEMAMDAPAPRSQQNAMAANTAQNDARGTRQALPATASSLPTVMAFGLLAALAALAARARRGHA
jgi:hypothetical protein